MIERELYVTLSEAVSLFETFKWKFYEIVDDKIRLEVKRGGDLLVVKLPKREDIEKKLREEGFIRQVIRAARTP